MPVITHSSLTQHDVLRLAEIVKAARQERKVVFLEKDGTQYKGTARHIVVSPDDIGFPGPDRDIRDCYLRVTMQTGQDRYESMAWVLEGLGTSFFVYDWSQS